ncbi:hypothetical protein GCM10029978_059500 [Actinoallomurus acanthiterrae]
MPISGEKLQDRARDTALALPGVSHGRPFTEQLEVYKVAGKVVLIVTDGPDEHIVTRKAEPEYGRLLQHEQAPLPTSSTSCLCRNIRPTQWHSFSGPAPPWPPTTCSGTWTHPSGARRLRSPLEPRAAG